MQTPVLVLNANFEPINVCNMRRAIALILNGRASLVANGRGVVHTVSHTYPIPSVIRLAAMIKRPRPHLKLTKREILRRDNFTCQYCGQRTNSLTIDHVIPRHLGGRDSWQNLVTACPTCNHHKGGRTLEQAHMGLLRIPAEPPASVMYIFSRHMNGNYDWMPFIEGW